MQNAPLRILVILNLPWDPRLGAARVWIELTEQWRSAGHVVEKYCLTDAFPEPTNSRPMSALRQVLFAYKARSFVRKNGGRFDVIDCLMGTLPFSKTNLSFHGLFVARSVGLNLLYERFQQFAEKRWPPLSKGKLIGRIFYRFTKWRLAIAAAKTIKHCDLVNLPNHDEFVSLHAEIAPEKPAIVEPYGLTEERRRAFSVVASQVEARWRAKKICFIGMWCERKGSRDWADIVRRIRAQHPDARFVFLGTMTDKQNVLTDLKLSDSLSVEIVPDYDPNTLPDLLAECAVGVFPSYLEGFGLAVLEQLAAGIPTVAYDAPGPREMLRASLPEFLVPAGDTGAIAEVVSKILHGGFDEYRALSERSAKATARFSWPAIAEETLAHYRAHLNSGS